MIINIYKFDNICNNKLLYLNHKTTNPFTGIATINPDPQKS